jgi:hypothetical protein
MDEVERVIRFFEEAGSDVGGNSTHCSIWISFTNRAS